MPKYRLPNYTLCRYHRTDDNPLPSRILWHFAATSRPPIIMGCLSLLACSMLPIGAENTIR
jgi:hypothetical protein